MNVVKRAKTITLDPDTINVIQGIERKTGKGFGQLVRELETDKAFICSECKRFLPIKEHLVTNLSGMDTCRECVENGR